MTVQPLIEDLDQWARAGRGREFQFYATGEEVQHWMQEALPAECEPYFLVGADRVEENGVYIDEPFKCEIENLLECIGPSVNPRHSFWIWSLKLTPNLPLQRGIWIDKLCSYNGLILLQHGLMVEDRRDPARHVRRKASRIAITDKVRNLESGAVHVHYGYLSVFEQLRRIAKKSLVYTSIIRDQEGKERESRSPMWTEGAVNGYLAGHPFWDSPGQLVSKRKARKGL